MQTYIALIKGTEQGPYSAEDLDMIESVGDITDDTMVRLAEHDVWKKWSRVKQELHEAAARKKRVEEAVLGPYLPATAGTRRFMRAKDQKSRLSFILLGLFFGALGVHNFYAGYPWSRFPLLAGIAIRRAGDARAYLGLDRNLTDESRSLVLGDEADDGDGEYPLFAGAGFGDNTGCLCLRRHLLPRGGRLHHYYRDGPLQQQLRI